MEKVPVAEHVLGYVMERAEILAVGVVVYVGVNVKEVVQHNAQMIVLVVAQHNVAKPVVEVAL